MTDKYVIGEPGPLLEAATTLRMVAEYTREMSRESAAELRAWLAWRISDGWEARQASAVDSAALTYALLCIEAYDQERASLELMHEVWLQAWDAGFASGQQDGAERERLSDPRRNLAK